MAYGEDSVTSNFDYLVDSDIFVALFIPDDALANRIDELLTEIHQSCKKLCTTNWVIAETATVLSAKDSHQTALDFLDMIDEGTIPILPVTPDIEHETHHIFREQTTKHTSMVDCSNVATAKHYDIPNILSFDKFYARLGYAIAQVNRA